MRERKEKVKATAEISSFTVLIAFLAILIAFLTSLFYCLSLSVII